MNEFKYRQWGNPSIQRIASNWDQKYFPLFEQVKKTWNIPIRNFYKKIMGVNLQDEETTTRQEIRINLLPICDLQIIHQIVETFGERDFEENQRLKEFLEASENVKKYFDISPQAENLTNLIAFAKDSIKDTEPKKSNEDLIKILCKGNPDIFGRYFGYSKKGEIDLFIIPCVLFCEANNWDLSTFVIMVLAHELAHGYNHLGTDKDNYIWDNFWDADVYLKEGLAQYYTREFLEKYISKIPYGVEIFDSLLEYQDKEYKSFKEWKTSPEKIYSAFIESRRNGINKEVDFLKLLDGAQKRILGDRKIIRDGLL